MAPNQYIRSGPSLCTLHKRVSARTTFSAKCYGQFYENEAPKQGLNAHFPKWYNSEMGKFANHSVSSNYCQVDPGLIGLLFQLNELFDGDSDVSDLRLQMESVGSSIRLDYQRISQEFNRAYFVKNFLKCYFYLKYISTTDSAPISGAYDIGAGAGSFSLALSCLFPGAKVIQIDKNREQASKAQAVAHVANLSRNWKQLHGDVFNVGLQSDLPRLMSFFACEQSPALASKVDKLLLGERAIIVDYPHVLRQYSLSNKRLGGTSVNYVKFCAPVPIPLIEIVGQESITVSGVTLHANSYQSI